jgi:hypothetical protein
MKQIGLLAVLLLVLGTAPAYAAFTPMPTGTDVDYQLGGDRSVPGTVGIVARDRTSTPIPGKYNVCYVNGFQTQPNEAAFWKKHTHLILRKNRKPIIDSAWGEQLLDTRTADKRKRIAAILGRWITGCARSGFQAVEFDNLDSYSRSKGLITRADNKAMAKLLVTWSHQAGLAAGQKNWSEWNAAVTTSAETTLPTTATVSW